MFSFTYVRRAFRASKYGKAALSVLFVGLLAASISMGGSLNPAGWAGATGTLTCSGSTSLAIGQEGTWTASGGSGNYKWSSPQSNGSGQVYKESFPNGGTKTITLTSGTETDTCTVQVSAGGGGGTGGGMTDPVSCSGPNKLAVGQEGTYKATGGDGTYQWSSPQSNGSGSIYKVTFPNGGDKTIEVTSGGKTATCNVHVSNTLTPTPGPISCSGPATLLVDQKGTFTGQGGTSGTYHWVSGQSTHDGPDYTISFPNTGLKTINITSGGQSGTCSVEVKSAATGGGGGTGGAPTSPDPLTVSCSGKNNNPSDPSINPGDTVKWTAKVSGGNGAYNYTWTGNGSFPSGVTGNPVTHTYLGGAGPRNANVTVTSGGQTETVSCTPIQVVEDTSSCAPLQYDSEIYIGSNTASIKVTNPNPAGSDCAQSYGLVSYDTSDAPWAGDNRDRFLAEQDIVDSDLRTIAPGTNPTLTVSIPACEFQVDFFRGNYVPSAVQLDDGYNGIQNLKFKISSGILTMDGKHCPTTTQDPDLFCTANRSSLKIGETVSFTANGGNGSYSWSVTGNGNPSTGNAKVFSTSFNTTGGKTATVTSGGKTATCPVTVYVDQIINPDIACTPLNQTVDKNETAFFSATGGDGTYKWTASGGNPSTGSNKNFSTSYNDTGTKLVLVSDNSGHQAQCQVQVKETVVGAPVCAPSSQDADINEEVDFTATGGNGSYSWSAPGASDTSGSGSNFETSYDDDGTYVVTVTSNGKSDTCIVRIDEEDDDDDDLSCSPSNQDADVDDFVTFRARGGSGTLRWTTDADADPDSDTGRTFTTQFEDEGRHTVRVRDSEGRTATCKVDIEEDFSPKRLSCSPSSQTGSVNEQLEFFANGGTGDFEWDADDGRPRSGFGRRFTTSFDEPGRYEVEVESNGRRDTCEVEIVEDDNGAPFCSPSTQSANVNDFVTFSATGGDGDYAWSTSADGLPTSGSGPSFGTRFLTSGNKLVTVTSNGRTSQCLVTIGSVLGASSIVTGPAETAAAAAGLGFLGALGAYGAVYRDRSKQLLAKVTKLIRR